MQQKSEPWLRMRMALRGLRGVLLAALTSLATPLLPGKPVYAQPHKPLKSYSESLIPPQRNILPPLTSLPPGPHPLPVPGVYPVGTMEKATWAFAATQSFQFRYTEERKPRFASEPEFRAMHLSGEAQRDGSRFRLRVNVTMEGGLAGRQGEWYSGPVGDTWQILYRPAGKQVWETVSSPQPWLESVGTRLQLGFLWSGDLYPQRLRQTGVIGLSGSSGTATILLPLGDSSRVLYRLTAGQGREEITVGVDATTGAVAGVTIRSVPPTLSLPDDPGFLYEIRMDLFGQSAGSFFSGVPQ